MLLQRVGAQSKQLQLFRNAVRRANRDEQMAIRRRLAREAPGVRTACLKRAQRKLKRIPLLVALAATLITPYPTLFLFPKFVQPLAERDWGFLVVGVPTVAVLVGAVLLIVNLVSIPRLRREIRDWKGSA